jgi:hypothetical protein
MHRAAAQLLRSFRCNIECVKTLFTVHVSEFLVGDLIERKFRSTNAWVPYKHTGVALLITDPESQRAVSLQVRSSRDFSDTYRKESLQRSQRACGCSKISPKQIKEFRSDHWVFVLLGFAPRSTDFVMIKPSELLRKLVSSHSDAEKNLQTAVKTADDNGISC